MNDFYTLPGIPSDAMTSDKPGTRRFKSSINEQMIDGDKALTVQPFTELNSKSGAQYEAAFYIASLAAGSNSDVVIIVGDQPVSIKDVLVGFNCEEISTQVFIAPTYTGGTPLAVYNFNDEQAVPDDVTVLAGVVTTATGTPVSPQLHSLGSEGQGNRRISALSDNHGIERILWNNSTYLFRITNRDDIATKITGFATWYQGPLSTMTELEQ